jgi:Domain of unknown function (DUF4399)
MTGKLDAHAPVRMGANPNTGHHGRRAASVLVLLAGLVAASALATTTLPSNEAELRCWLQHTAERTRVNVREPTAVEFSNLRDGWRVRSPFLVEFAVRGMGVAPIGQARPGTGHHHVLIDSPLPKLVGEPIPFDAKHRHFGKGQTSTLLDLPAGRHTLRLLFADHDHRPHFVYSREIAVQVLGPRESVPPARITTANFDTSCQLWYEDQTSTPRPAEEQLYIANLRAGESAASPLNVRLGVSALGVCARGSCPEKTGHFRLEVLEAAGRRPLQNQVLAKGNTQLNLSLPNGDYVLRLNFLDDAGKPLLPAQDMPIKVNAQTAL